MIEVVFHDGAAEALKSVKQMIPLEETPPEQGRETEHLLSVGLAPSDFGPKISGCAQDVLALHLLADVGDIRSLDRPVTRRALYAKWLTAYVPAADFETEIQNFVDTLTSRIALLKKAAETETPIRFWWSDAPGEICGLYWAMAFLKGTQAPLHAIRIPRYAQVTENSSMILSGTSGLAPEDFYTMLSYQRPITLGEQDAMAREWKTLEAENSLLRADVNGMLLSVPEDFYDHILLHSLPASPFFAANLIGRLMVEKPIGIDPWLYRYRLTALAEAGILRCLPTPEGVTQGLLYMEKASC